MDLRYWGRVGSALVAHPHETVCRVRQRVEMWRFAGGPKVNYVSDDDWEQELSRRLPAVAGTDSEGWQRVISSLDSDLPGFPTGHDADAALARSLWRIVRATRAEKIVETGVARGVTSRFLLDALEANAGGHLWSIDLPPILTGFHDSVGDAVPLSLRHRWTYIRGSSREKLPSLLRELGTVDLFVQDSLGTLPTVHFELSLAWRALRPSGWLVVNGIDRGAAFGRFLAEHKLEPIIAQSTAKQQYGTDGVIQGQFGLVQKVD